METIYYVAPTLDSTHTISDDLHGAGVKDWHIHIVSKDEAGLKRDHLHSSNYVETMDFLAMGLMGAFCGFVVGIIAAAALASLQTLGPDVPGSGYIFFAVITTLFGAWFGGFIGVQSENKKLAPFHDEINAGKYLFLIYAGKDQVPRINAMMKERHPESVHVATDEHFLDPFRTVRRKEGVAGQSHP